MAGCYHITVLLVPEMPAKADVIAGSTAGFAHWHEVRFQLAPARLTKIDGKAIAPARLRSLYLTTNFLNTDCYGAHCRLASTLHLSQRESC